MRLVDLDARFLGWLGAGSFTHGPDGLIHQHGVMFLCPKCFEENYRKREGVHSVICWFLNPLKGDPVPDDASPGPGRWARQGESIETLTLGPGRNGARSVLLNGGCAWHGFVIDGEVTTC